MPGVPRPRHHPGRRPRVLQAKASTRYSYPEKPVWERSWCLHLFILLSGYYCCSYPQWQYGYKTVKGSALEDFEHWYQGLAGRALLAAERVVLRRAIQDSFGLIQLNVLVSHRLPVATETHVVHRFDMVPRFAEGLSGQTLVANLEEWPVANEIADVLVLHHSLDYSESPHQTLREAQRVLKPSGHLFVLGFNPWSTWGLRRMLSKARKGPWAANFISSGRLQDWLCLLDFEVAEKAHHFFLPPLGSFTWLSKLAFLDRLGPALRLPTGAFYLVHARKKVPCMTPLRPSWKKSRLAASPVVPQVVPFEPNENR
ncbi:MAG: methyltransferase domain-containing protein [Gammaproteobacteria bacterium]|nr:MAG: methyltransferase domain-containing protein [Gammaproteobacteria bacterium]